MSETATSLTPQQGAVSLALLLCPPLWAALPPAGLGYLAESVAEAGIPVKIYDLNILAFGQMDKTRQRDWTVNPAYTHEDFYTTCRDQPWLQPDLLTALRKQGATHLGFSVFKSNRAFSLALARWLKHELPAATIIFGGPEVFTMQWEGQLQHSFIDHYVAGEGETALLHILTCPSPRIIPSPGIVSSPRKASGSRTPPWPRYRNFKLTLYTRPEALPIVASRGCLNRCRFCAERLLFTKYRAREAEEICEEIHYHIGTRGIRHFIFYDSLFNGNLKQMEALLDGLASARLMIRWEAQICIRPDMSPRLLMKMQASGCVNLFLGLESGSAGVLKKMRKPFTPQLAAAFLHTLSAAGLQSEISLITHYPGETPEEFEETLTFIRTNRHVIKKIAQVSRYRPYPGTEVPTPKDYNPSIAEKKIACLVALFRELGIPYTKSYIDNLI